MDISDDKVIELQRVLGRTHSGRLIVPGRGTAWEVLNAPPEGEIRDKAECMNCAFVFYEPAFVNGCPNCGSMDYNSVR